MSLTLLTQGHMGPHCATLCEYATVVCCFQSAQVNEPVQVVNTLFIVCSKESTGYCHLRHHG